MMLPFGTNADVSESNLGSIQDLFRESYNNKYRPLLPSRRLDRPGGCPLAFDPVTLGRMVMNRTVLKFLSILLVLCVLSVGGLAQAQSVEHAGHHAHHQAATHGTVLCSLMCAAGTVLDSAVVLIQTERSPIALIPLTHSTNSSVELCQSSPSRAPPSFSL